MPHITFIREVFYFIQVYPKGIFESTIIAYFKQNHTEQEIRKALEKLLAKGLIKTMSGLESTRYKPAA